MIEVKSGIAPTMEKRMRSCTSLEAKVTWGYLTSWRLKTLSAEPLFPNWLEFEN